MSTTQWETVEGFDPETKFGPNTLAVRNLIRRVKAMTPDEGAAIDSLATGEPYISIVGEVLDGPYPPEYGLAFRAAYHAVDDTPNGAAYDGILAVAVRDRITPEQYKALTDPLASVIGSEYF